MCLFTENKNKCALQRKVLDSSKAMSQEYLCCTQVYTWEVPSSVLQGFVIVVVSLVIKFFHLGSYLLVERTWAVPRPSRIQFHYL